MLMTKEVNVTVTARNLKHYRSKGYDNISINMELVVSTIDLLPSSHVMIRYKCDNCGKEFETSYCYWNKRKLQELGDMCKTCARLIKQPQSMLQKYGYSNSANVPSIIEKKKNTNLKKYGVEWAVASDVVKETIKETMLSRYGVENPMQNESIKNKAIDTISNRTKEDWISIIAKSEATCMQKYGVTNPYKNKDIQSKARETLYKNGTVPSSKAEHRFCEILRNIFGEEHCFTNYPVGNLSLDCLVIIGENKIDFEYDGCYWHKNKEQYDRRRNGALMNDGYKIVRVKANNKDEMPTIEQIKKAVDYLVEDNHHIAFIDMNI